MSAFSGAIRDQAEAELLATAALVASYYARLVERGVPPAHAAQITLDFQRTILTPPSKPAR